MLNYLDIFSKQFASTSLQPSYSAHAYSMDHVGLVKTVLLRIRRECYHEYNT
jgi:hypothetical protein